MRYHSVMQWKETARRELYVAIHAQTWRFRVRKYVILLGIAAATWWWKGGWAVLWLFVGLTVLALAVHFIFRWKTKAWTRSWGPYKKIDIPGDA